ncbi:MAG: glycosyltransferase family 39 protein [Ruminococcus sp.]|uniref:glycosyltransferase family 39 protein n=1 Tax=Ruminococcus sp. TaxID=41978 RepID=UPI0025EC3574|nr:glycosyltransferase family 39 protein [Ruminococcus sp.]MCR4793972.1 glycosyltransferase family 39 protein [Ruminococcus sp.]
MKNTTSPSNNKTIKSQGAIQKLFGILAAHPYISMFAACFICTLPFFGDISYITPTVPIIMYFIFCISASCIITNSCNKRHIKNPLQLIFIIAAVTVTAPIFMYFRHYGNRMLLIFFYGIILTSAFYYSFYSKKLERQFNVFLIIGLSFVIKLCYVLGTTVYNRQHDIGRFGTSNEIAEGHMGYISYIFYNHHIYDGDYRQYFQYCHPPLHHTICALWIGFANKILHIDLEKATEFAQVLPLFYSMTIIITAYKIFRYFKLEGSSLYIPLIITAFHPCFTFLSGLMNNDALAWAFTMAAVLCTLKWYKEPTLGNIMRISLCMGLSMMSKLSAALAAFPIAVVLLTVFLRSLKTSWKKLTGQFAAFLAVCFPLGMWFPIRGLTRWGIPLTYVQPLGDLPQRIKGITFFQRITDFSFKQVRNVYENWLWFDEAGEPQAFNEHNPLIAILKNSIFSECINGNNFNDDRTMLAICQILFWLGVALAAAAFAAMIFCLFRKCSADKVEKIFLAFFHLTLVINLYILSKNYPLVCSMKFRYLMPTVITGAIFLGLYLLRFENSKKRSVSMLKTSLTASAITFAVFSSVVYLVVVL